jgi:hypothetical protein
MKDCSNSYLITSEVEDSIVLFLIGDTYTDLMWAGIEPLNE